MHSLIRYQGLGLAHANVCSFSCPYSAGSSDRERHPERVLGLRTGALFCCSNLKHQSGMVGLTYMCYPVLSFPLAQTTPVCSFK